MFKDRKDYLLKVLQVVYNFVTYGDKDTLPMDECEMGNEQDDICRDCTTVKKMKTLAANR